MKSVLALVLIFSVIVMSAGTISGLSYNQNAFAVSSPPSVTIGSPANGATVTSSTVTITGTASSASNTISTVQVSVDGAPYAAATGTTSWSYTATGLASGLHSITAKAIDSQGLVGYSTNVLTGGTIFTGNGQELAFVPANGNVYVANIAQGTISVISSATNNVISTISGLPGPTGIAYDSVNGYLYTANYNQNNISVVDTATNHIVTTFNANAVHPFGVVYVPNGKVYVANTGSNTVSVIDPSSNTIVATIPVGVHPQDFAYDPVNQALYMTNQGTNNVSVIDVNPSDVTYNHVLSSIPVGSSPRGIAYDPANGKMYVANFGSNTVSIIDTSNNSVTSVLTGSSGGPNGVAFDPANGFVYVPDFAGTRLNVMDSATGTFINPVTLPVAPYYYYAAFDPINSDIYITSGSNVAVIQTQTQFTVSLASTSTSVISSQNPSTFGQSISFTATVTPSTATGNIVFTIDGVPQAPVTATSGQATFSSSSLSVGTHSITAAYSGDTSDLPSASSTLTQTVNQAPTSVSLASATNPSTIGQSATFTATINNTGTGSITFMDGSNTLSTVPLTGNSASYATSSLSLGLHSITAVYSGDASFANATSNTVTQTVNKITTATTLSSSSNSVNAGQQVSLNATVSPAVPDGETITFYDGITSIGTGATSGGMATLAVTLPVGNHSITASYPGDANDLNSTSSPVTVTVLSLQQEKQGVIASLQSISAANNDDKQDIKQAIEAVQDSVNASLWQADGMHLVVKKGDKVFDYEKQAADHMADVIREGKESSSTVTVLQNDISTLVNVDQKLATTAISDAGTAASGLTGDHAKDVQSDISQAQKEMTQASGEIAKGQFAAGIEHYGNAWKHAEDAIADASQNEHGSH